MDDLKLYSRSEKGLDSLVQTACVFSEDIGMESGAEKCAMLAMEKGKIVKSFGIELPDGKVIKSLQEGESYKYLGILEADKFLEEKMKLDVSKEYIRRLRKVLKSELNGGNLVRGVSTCAVSLLNIQQHLLVGVKVNCRLYIEKLESCLPYMDHYTLHQV